MHLYEYTHPAGRINRLFGALYLIILGFHLRTESSGQRFHHVLQLGDLQRLPEAIVGARPLRIEIEPAARGQGDGAQLMHLTEQKVMRLTRYFGWKCV